MPFAFEVGKRYYAESGSSCVFEIIKRTAKRICFAEIQHEGRYNEKMGDLKTASIKDWQKGEVFITKSGATIASYNPAN